jgi:hypothetical protein
MMKAGLIEEMMNDTLDSALDTEDMEEETEAEVGGLGCWGSRAMMHRGPVALGRC